jgi:hypothetical protein
VKEIDERVGQRTRELCRERREVLRLGRAVRDLDDEVGTRACSRAAPHVNVHNTGDRLE